MQLKQRMGRDGPENTPPIIVRKTSLRNTANNGVEAACIYQIIDGEQRWQIASELGWECIYALERDVDDVETKALCVSYNRWRGRLQWLKLYTVMEQDAEAGVDVYGAYGEALTKEEIEQVLSLGNIAPELRAALEASMKKYAELSLEHLHIISQFPVDQQKGIVETFQTPVTTRMLLQALSRYTNQSSFRRPTTLSNQYRPHKTGHGQESLRLERRMPEGAFGRGEQQATALTPPSQAETEKVEGTENEVEDEASAFCEDASAVHDEHAVALRRQVEVVKALLVDMTYDCECGRHHVVSWKNMKVTVQKPNGFFEYVDLKPRTFQVYCSRCDGNHEFSVSGVEGETLRVFCALSKREGVLDVNTGEVTWFN